MRNRAVLTTLLVISLPIVGPAADPRTALTATAVYTGQSESVNAKDSVFIQVLPGSQVAVAHRAPAAVVYSEGFEASDGGYTTSGTNNVWEWGSPVSWPEACAEGSMCWGTNLNGAYPAAHDGVLHAVQVDVSSVPAGTELTISWWQAYDVERYLYDEAGAFVSVNGGVEEVMWTNPDATTEVGWVRHTFTPAIPAAWSTIDLRFELLTDTSAQYDGYYVDMIGISTPQPDFSFSTKTFSDTVIKHGVPFTVDIVVDNSGNQDAVGVSLSDALPAGMLYVSGPTCGQTCAWDGSTVSWTGDLPQGTSDTISFDVVIDASAPCGGAVENTAWIDHTSLASPFPLSATAKPWEAVVFDSDFESDDGGLVPDTHGGEWEWGTPTYPVGLTAHSGSGVWGTDLDGDASDVVANHTLEMGLDLRAFTVGYPIELHFWDWIAAEALDERQILIDGDVVLSMGQDVDQQFWAETVLDLSPWVGQTVTLAFNFEVCCSDPGPDGWYIDDVSVVGCVPPPGVYVLPEDQAVYGCAGLQQTYSVDVFSNVGGDAVFSVAYDVPTGNGSLRGPSAVAVRDFSSTALDVQLAPDGCLPDGTTVVGEIFVTDGVYSGAGTITGTIVTAHGFESDTFAPLGLLDPGAAAIGDLIYTWGNNDTATSTTATVFDTLAGSWSAIAPLPIGLKIAGGAAHALNVYSLGGYDGTSLSAACHSYDPGSDTWSAVAAAPRSVAAYGACGSGGLIYRLGGAADLGTFPAADAGFEVYDPGTGSWTSLPAVPFGGRTWASVECLDGKIYVAGGLDNGSALTDTLHIYDIATSTWSTGADLPDTRWGAGSYVFADTIHLVGGVTGSNDNDGSAIAYNPSHDSWAFVGTMLGDATFRLAGAATESNGWVFGGMTEIAWDNHADNQRSLLCPECSSGATVSGTVATDPVRVSGPGGITVEVFETAGGTLVAAGTTDALGAYSLHVPADSHDVVVSFPGFLYGSHPVVVTDGSFTILGPVTLLGGDVNGDDVVNITDITTVAGVFGFADAVSDLNGDGTVNITDIAAAAANFGFAAPVPWP